MNIVTHQKKSLFSLACLCTAIMFFHIPYVNASKKGGNIAIDDIEEKPRKVVNQGKSKCESEGECGGCFTSVKAPGVDVKVSAKKAGMKVKS